MRVRNFLRVIITLAFAGLFVAGALSVTKLFGLGLPCGGTQGCDVVNNHASSKWFNVPVAYIGFFGYLALATLAALRSGMPPLKARGVALVGYLISAFGALTSVGLQIYSLTVIHATCLWCMASAAIMVTLLVFHALEYGDRVAEDAPAGKGEFAWTAACAVAAILGLMMFRMSLTKAGAMAQVVPESAIASAPLVPEGAHIYGDKDAPVTIIEFADMMCPTCQQVSPKAKEFVSKRFGKVRLVYRNFPLSMHKMGMLSAAVGEAAADEGKFWEYLTAIMATGENMETSDRVFEVAQSVGLDPEKIKEKLKDENGPPTKRLLRDINAANALGLTRTPTFIVQVKGMETQAYSYQTMIDEMENGRYKAKLEGK